jgi:hypothetical protein
MKKLLMLFFVASLCACGDRTSTTVDSSDSTTVVDTIDYVEFIDSISE